MRAKLVLEGDFVLVLDELVSEDLPFAVGLHCFGYILVRMCGQDMLLFLLADWR